MEIKFKKLNPGAMLPTKAHSTDAGLDLTAAWTEKDEHGTITYGCGLVVEIPQGYVGLLFPRSSIYKTGLVLTNCVGVIDAGYRGEIMAKFNISLSTDLYVPYKVGERFAQLLIMPIPQVDPVLADTLSDSDRGAGGYGSSGK